MDPQLYEMFSRSFLLFGVNVESACSVTAFKGNVFLQFHHFQNYYMLLSL